VNWNFRFLALAGNRVSLLVQAEPGLPNLKEVPGTAFIWLNGTWLSNTAFAALPNARSGPAIAAPLPWDGDNE
jgi:hypothetical protein